MLQIVIRNWIIPACDLQVVVGRWLNHELELVTTRVILRISYKGVELGCARWWLWLLEFEDGSPQRGRWFKLNNRYLSLIVLFIFSINPNSPYLFVFGDDRVTCYTEANGVPGEDMDAQRWKEG